MDLTIQIYLHDKIKKLPNYLQDNFFNIALIFVNFWLLIVNI